MQLASLASALGTSRLGSGHVSPRPWASTYTRLVDHMKVLYSTPFPPRGLSSEPSMDVGALGWPPGAPPGPPRYCSG